ncbi:unnamed protein product [Prunus armeniaca]|uniref:Uncharacterized protein n=1 Tax=Prunus armeniaca TaxID=36596 RepID=A0A6J5WAB3_PRUAR|nr:unnamed protein product [Prunus armeniaca]
MVNGGDSRLCITSLRSGEKGGKERGIERKGSIDGANKGGVGFGERDEVGRGTISDGGSGKNGGKGVEGGGVVETIGIECLNGKVVSSNVTWRLMYTLPVLGSRHLYPLC